MKHVVIMILGTHLMACALLAGDPGGVFDEYGGVLSVKGQATGIFHLEKINGRHCLVKGILCHDGTPYKTLVDYTTEANTRAIQAFNEQRFP